VSSSKRNRLAVFKSSLPESALLQYNVITRKI
jgi:hypothetical protein